MAKRGRRPVHLLSLDEQAAIERCRVLVRHHAEETWKLLFPPPSFPTPLDPSQEFPPRQPASLQVELRDYSCALFSCEAQQYTVSAKNEAELRSSLKLVAECIKSEAIKETAERFRGIRCTLAQRKSLVSQALAQRIENCLKWYRNPTLLRSPADPITPFNEEAAPVSTSPEIKKTDRTQVSHPPETAKPETIGEQIDRLRRECDDMTVEELAEQVDLHPTNVSRHMRGESKPTPKNRRVYQRVFSKFLNRQIVISETQEDAAKRS